MTWLSVEICGVGELGFRVYVLGSNSSLSVSIHVSGDLSEPDPAHERGMVKGDERIRARWAEGEERGPQWRAYEEVECAGVLEKWEESDGSCDLANNGLDLPHYVLLTLLVGLWGAGAGVRGVEECRQSEGWQWCMSEGERIWSTDGECFWGTPGWGSRGWRAPSGCQSSSVPKPDLWG